MTLGAGAQIVDKTASRAEQHWFIRRDRDEVGPLSSQELRRLAEQGVVTPQTPVSADRVTWHAAMTLRGLFPGGVPAGVAAQTSAPPQAPAQPAMSPPPAAPPVPPASVVSPSALPNRHVLPAKQLRDAIVNYVLDEQSCFRDIPSIIEFHMAHRELLDHIQKAKERIQQLTAAGAAHSPLELALYQKKKELAGAEADLSKMAQSLGNAAFHAFLAGKVRELTVFAERLDLHRKIADLESEMQSLAPQENAGMIEKTKAKGQQLIVAGKIKLAAMKENSLETTIGRNLLHTNQEESVRCDRTSSVLDTIRKQRSCIAALRAQASEAATALENKRMELCHWLGLEKIEGKSTLDSELRKCQDVINQKEKECLELEAGLPDRLLTEPNGPQQGLLAEMLGDLRRAGAAQKTRGAASRTCGPTAIKNGFRRKPAWVVGFGIIACVLLVVTCAISNSETPNTAGRQTSPTLPQTMTREQIVAQKTLAYWRGIAAVEVFSSPAERRTPQAIIAAFRRAAEQIRVLGTVDVDTDAVRCGNDVATLFVNVADNIEHSNSPDMWVEAFLRGLSGDLFGPTLDSLDANSAISQQAKQVQTEVENARAILSSRYRVEFPRH